MSAQIPPGPPIEPTAGGSGLGKKIFIGCGIVALVLAACLFGFILYLRQHPETATDFVMKQIESHYAADVTQQDKDDLRAAYAEFRTALKEHRVPERPLEGLRTRLTVKGSQNEITRDQVHDMTELFRQAAGSRPAAGAPAPPAPSPRPSP